MPWLLTTPLDVGDMDEADYTHVRIIHQTHDSVRAFIQLGLEYGRVVNNAWVPGTTPKGKPSSCFIIGADYDTLTTASTPELNELTYDAVKRGLYQYLVTKEVIGAGTLV
jgi:hypothetical protein